jgi:peroxiredoxin
VEGLLNKRPGIEDEWADVIYERYKTCHKVRQPLGTITIRFLRSRCCKQATMQQHADFPSPPGTPRPVNGGAADHLRGMAMPSISLPSTFGGLVDLSRQSSPRTVVYGDPMIGLPGKPLPDGWDPILGECGWTPETCGFQEHYGELLVLRAEVFGLNTQTTEFQGEMARRHHLPFEILSDAEFKLCDALRLPTVEVNGMRLLEPLTLIIRGGRIEHVFYPVFPLNESADQVVQWLTAHPLT